MSAAAFQATYADWRVIKGRKVVSISFEVPIEQADLAYQVVGGMPDPSKSVWFAVARLNQGGANQEPNQPTSQTQREAEPEGHPVQSLDKWGKLSLAQQAGILCGEAAFHKFLAEKIAPDADFERCSEQAAKDLAADIVRHHCLVQSRKDLREHTPNGRLWRGLVMDYRAWMREPEMVG